MTDMRRYLNLIEGRLDVFETPVQDNFLLSLLESTLLIEKTTPSEAAAVLKRYGASDDVLRDPKLLKAFRNQFMLKNHSDTGAGNLAAVQAVNDAFDVIGKSGYHQGSRPSYDEPESRSSHQDEPYPVWAHAGYSGGTQSSPTINRKNYSDLNFIKKTMWELSGHSREEWTIMNFDGTYFRGMLTVYGNSEIFPEMAKAMVQWDNYYKHRAIFVMKKRATAMELIWLDGKDVSPVVFYRSDMSSTGWDANMPYNDQHFMRELPGFLDDIASGNGDVAYGDK